MAGKEKLKKNRFGNAMKRALYFPPKKIQMCREYCPRCKRLCVYSDNHISPLTEKPLPHMCGEEHQW